MSGLPSKETGSELCGADILPDPELFRGVCGVLISWAEGDTLVFLMQL